MGNREAEYNNGIPGWLELYDLSLHKDFEAVTPKGAYIRGNISGQKWFEPLSNILGNAFEKPAKINFMPGWVELNTLNVHRDIEAVAPIKPYVHGKFDSERHFYPDEPFEIIGGLKANNLITYKIVEDMNDRLKNTAKIACNFWNRFVMPKSSVIVRLGIFEDSISAIALAYKPYEYLGNIYGTVLFNTKYLKIFTDYQIAGTLIHEIGHTLGFGWDMWMRLFHRDTGRFRQEYINRIRDLDIMLVETDYQSGTRYSHWDEETFDKELMTGFKDNPEHVLPVTIDIMELLGHGVIERLQGKTGLNELMSKAENIMFTRTDEVEKIDLDYYKKTGIREKIYSSDINFDALINQNLPEEVWSLIQRGLNHAGYYEGTYYGRPGPKTRAAFEAYLHSTEAEWMDIARAEIGVKEYAGEADNPDVVKYLKSVEALSRSDQRNDETAWCSAFVNWCIEQAGLPGTNSAAARSWLEWGTEIQEPEEGCIVVLWRDSPESWKGHVGFFIKENSNNIYILGGNQNDEVNISHYPKYRVLSYRTY